MPMTLEEIEKKVVDQDVILKALTADNEILKSENEAVMKMTKTERKLYSAMDDSTRKEYITAKVEKRKNMMDVAHVAYREKKLTDEMDEATKAEFLKAGPEQRRVFLEKAEAILAKKKKKDEMPAEGSDEEEKTESQEEEDQEDADMAKMLVNETLALKVAESSDHIVKMQEELSTLRKRDRLVTFTKRAEAELPHTSGTPEEKGNLLMSLADSLPGGEAGDVYKQTFDNLKAADKALSLHYGEVGKAGGPIPAEKVLDAKVAEISKRDKISISKAMEKAMLEAPELYLDYERQHRQYVTQQ